MKTIVLVLAMVMAMVGTAIAEGYQCPPPPCPECQPVQVTCECNCEKAELPGLWEMVIKGKRRCGTITVIGSSFMFDGEFFVINKLKFAKAVESCSGFEVDVR